jgi:NTP pyrophosphatase (non-canonical NTP hydrolase)
MNLKEKQFERSWPRKKRRQRENMKEINKLEICQFKPEEIDEVIESLDGLQEIIVPFLTNQNYEGMGERDAEQFQRHIMLAKHALIAMGDLLEEKMNGQKMLNKLRDEIHQTAVEHGWWDDERTFGDVIALCHSELSEALEEYRNGMPMVYFPCNNGGMCDSKTSNCKSKKPEGIAIELADCMIRILDYCGHAGIDIEEAIRIKHEYNKTRSYRHGGKSL